MLSKLLKHFETVLEIHEENGDWRNYDYLYRFSIHSKSGSWDVPNLESKMSHKAVKLSAPKPSYNPNFSKQTVQSSSFKKAKDLVKEDIPPPYCRNFHLDGVKCTGSCNYVHQCPNCANGSEHSVQKCSKRLRLPFRAIPRDRPTTSQGAFKSDK